MDIIFSQDGKLSSQTFPENTKCQILKPKPNTKKWMETLFPYSLFFGSLLFVSLSTDHDDHYSHHGHGDCDHNHDVVDEFFFDYILSHVFDISRIFWIVCFQED